MVGEGTHPDFDKSVLRDSHADFGAFIRSVNVKWKYDAKPPDYYVCVDTSQYVDSRGF